MFEKDYQAVTLVFAIVTHTHLGKSDLEIIPLKSRISGSKAILIWRQKATRSVSHKLECEAFHFKALNFIFNVCQLLDSEEGIIGIKSTGSQIKDI